MKLLNRITNLRNSLKPLLVLCGVSRSTFYTPFEPSINFQSHPHLKHISKCWASKDGEYHILFDEIKGYKHLRISRKDKKPVHNWMDIQQIKNDILGVDVIAIEIYPKQAEFINGSNTYHIWTWEGISVPNLAELYEYRS
jgi:hypothetical protein